MTAPCPMCNATGCARCNNGQLPVDEALALARAIYAGDGRKTKERKKP